MTRATIYAVVGIAIFLLGLYAVIARVDLLRRVVAANVMAAGVFLFYVAMAAPTPMAPPDPVPQAMVLTGIVVSVSATALGLALVRYVRAATGEAKLPEDRHT
ncbi:Na+/H+ antiporter subunit C [Persicimonas caeni]|jgi:multicomponent Na+:H+ antiporter subunit C|uniref:Na+/H+ antiporter subunit C n=1 Tax=Persicimonas caeni TaxID=2292766 RepID=A0A4Y6PXG6_PERCE|nr:NADH-quinone oxidoreductase subunit K [Persicimonas caeni]QDG53006.1 Na+/H+ antiporter subunit C [Persicimonas caeni]QED34228.1 Na+/H+ antiporter subunit C [Persicimonas caeni]